jgi:hypothetical protein
MIFVLYLSHDETHHNMTKKKQYVSEKYLEPEDLVEENRPAFPPRELLEIQIELETTVRIVKVTKIKKVPNGRR